MDALYNPPLTSDSQEKDAVAELRDYQEDLLQQVESALDADRKARVMMQLPTGGGKTVIAGELLRRRLTNGRKAVWLTHRKELGDQTRAMLTEHGVSATFVRRDWDKDTDAPAVSGGVVILTAQTVALRTDKMEVWSAYSPDDLMVIDEAHHATAKGWAQAMEQWPGQALGMTATPWRLSEKEGFDHLFGELICGPQVADLQSDGWLCGARVQTPPSDRRILGGVIARTRDYTESGIELANAGRDVMTVGALRYWQEHARARQTIVYAVSVDHARNLVDIFNDAGATAEAILSETDPVERDKTIEAFRVGKLMALVNVAVATEGFDLPDASCVVITRPTESLALFMQMVGRGLRPKDGGGDCLILDLAANSLVHGLPNKRREWSLKPRSERPSGEAPMDQCDVCATEIYLAQHNCSQCGAALGKECGRCGKWRAWRSWAFENHCGDAHELVCDYCHIDAHIQAHLPVIPPLDELNDLVDEEDDGMKPQINNEIKGDLADRLTALLGELLEQERQAVVGGDEARKEELAQSIRTHERLLNDEDTLDSIFKSYADSLPEEQRPQNRPQWSRMFSKWEEDLQEKLAAWRNELDGIEDKPIDKELIFGNAQGTVISLLSSKARDIGLLPSKGGHSALISSDTEPSDDWILISSAITNAAIKGRKPMKLQTPGGEEIKVKSWSGLLVEVAEWLIREDRLSVRRIALGPRRYLINDVPEHKSGAHFPRSKILSNGLFMDTNHTAKQICDRVEELSQHGDAPGRFHMRLTGARSAGSLRDAKNTMPDSLTDTSSDWILISSSVRNTAIRGRKPKTLRTPDGQEVQINHWTDLLIEVTEWIIRAGRLPEWSILASTGKQAIVDLKDTGFSKARRLSNGLYLETHLNSIQLMYRAAWFIQISDPHMQFHVRVS